jgi:hypothetical protein
MCRITSPRPSWPGVPGPVKATDQLPRGNAAARFNAWFAVKITSGVGTMWCAYAFAALRW